MSSSAIKPETWQSTNSWAGASEQKDRWSVPQTALFVGAASIGLWGTIFALISLIF